MPEEYGCRDSITTLFYSLYNIYLVNLEMKHAVDVTCCAKQSHVSVDDSLNVVYVIGESYIKCHSQLYGYYLPTTPNLYQEKKKGNLFVFDNVVSPFNRTTLTMKIRCVVTVCVTMKNGLIVLIFQLYLKSWLSGLFLGCSEG